MAKKRHHSSKAKVNSAHAMGTHHTTSSVESHEDNMMDPRAYHEHKRGQEQAMQRKTKMLGYHDYYSGVDARRHQEMQDAGMIRENPAAIANMPQEVMIKPYPKPGNYLPEVLDDTLAGVDRQMDYDDHKRSLNFYPKKV